MFDLEKSIADWRTQMLAAGIKTPVPLEELEIHLREEIERRTKSGLNERRAFEIAARQIGQPSALKNEFKKINAGTWNHPLAWTAWTLFAVSFFLPAYTLGAGWWNTEMLGWEFALFSAGAACLWPETVHNGWPQIHVALLTLPNLLMIASPFLLPRFSPNTRSLKWLRGLNFAAMALVWSFLLQGWNDPKIGAYVWAVSFLLLCLSTLKIRSRKMAPVKYV